MTDSPQTQDNKNPGDMNNPSDLHVISAPSADPNAADKKSEVITEKFLTVAKEKSYLESLIMSQNDTIKELEKEKEKLTLSLRKFTASHKSMKEKLLDFDILRNMEISELKKKIEQIMADNKKLISEKDSIFRNLERDQKNISHVDNRVVGSLIREKREVEETGENLKSAADNIQELESELSLSRSQTAEITLDRDETRAELYNVRVELDHLKADKAHVEENLQEKVHDYSREIAKLRTDIDELTSAIESKIHVIDALNTKVVRLSGELSHKDSELHEKIPALLDKINSLSQSIDMKMEENSLFAKELFDLNVKISTLNEEMIEKDELLIDITEDYKKQKDEIEALHGAHELTIKNLIHERDLLKKESEEVAAEHAESLTALRAKIPLLNQQLLEKQELLTVMASEREYEKNEFLYQTDALKKEKTHQNEEMNRLIARGHEQEENLAEHISLLDVSQKEKAALEEDLAQAAEKIYALVLEQDRVVSLCSRKEQSLSDARAEITMLQANAAALRAYQAELQKKIAEKQEISGLARTEKEDLQKKILEYQETFEHLKQEIISLNKNLAEKEQTINLLLSEKDNLAGDISDLRSKLQASQHAGLETPIPVIEKRVETLPARVEKVSSTNKRSLAYTLLALLLLAGIGFSFYAFTAGLITLPMQRPAVREEEKKELAYNDMFSMLTKASVSDDLKFQATLLTESLVLKSATPGEKALFDFQNHLYFKVSISAPMEGLDDEMTDDPYPMITLTAGTDTVKPLSHIHVKDIKTFYRKEEPVSIMFYCAFPRTALTPDSNPLSLSFKNKKSRADIAWDLKSLSAGNLFP